MVEVHVVVIDPDLPSLEVATPLNLLLLFIFMVIHT